MSFIFYSKQLLVSLSTINVKIKQSIDLIQWNFKKWKCKTMYCMGSLPMCYNLTCFWEVQVSF